MIGKFDSKVELLNRIVALLREEVEEFDFDTATVDGITYGDISQFAVGIGILVVKDDWHKNLAAKDENHDKFDAAFRSIVEYIFSTDGAFTSGVTVILSSDGSARAKFDFGEREVSPLKPPTPRWQGRED